MAAISDALAEESPATNKGHRATVDPLRERVTSQRVAPDIAAAAWRRRVRPADVLRERRQPAARTHERAGA